MRKRLLSILLTAFVGLSTVGAQHAAFHSKLLEKIGKSIGYTPVDTLHAGTYPAGTALGKPLIAEYDSRHTVVNLGFHLFSQEMKQLYASDVYSFLERYFLELYVWKDKSTLQLKLNDDKVFFTSGSIASLKNIDVSTSCSISRTEDKYYEVTWTDQKGNRILSVAFPIQYELLLGMPQVEIANTIYDRIVTAPEYADTISEQQLEAISDCIYRTTPKKHYELESVNDCRYFRKDKVGRYQLIMDSSDIEHSVTNAFLMLSKCNNPMKVEQSVYGFKELNYTITLQQWLRYCHSASSTIYASIEEEYDDGYKVLIIAQNKDLGFNHLLSVLVPRNFLEKPTAEFKCKLNAFVPTHNVKNLYQQYKKKTKKKFGSLVKPRV